jgi:hypothetical protein
VRLPRYSILFLVLITACSGPPQAAKETTTVASPQPKLATTVRVASIDFFNLKRRIEKKDVERFAEVVKSEQVEVLAVQGITRYPNVKTRIDFVEEFPARSDMHRSFGETIDMSGQQRVNAVFSMYPIQWSNKKEFDVPSAFYESALQVSVDAGVSDVVIVSTRLPEKITSKEFGACVDVLASLQPGNGKPFVVTGNLPPLDKVKAPAAFVDIQAALSPEAGKTTSTRLWYTQAPLFKPIAARTVKTDLGMMTVVEFGLYQPAIPQ